MLSLIRASLTGPRTTTFSITLTRARSTATKCVWFSSGSLPSILVFFGSMRSPAFSLLNQCTRCFEQTSYQVTNQPILPGQYIIGIYNYKGRRIEADCDISLTVTACYTGDGACEGSRNAHRGFQTGAGWFLGLFMLAGLPLFCFIPVFYCIRRIRVAHHQRHGHAEQMSWVAGVGPQGHTRPRPLAGLTDAEIASVSSFVLGTGNGRNRDQSTQHPSLGSDTCSVCLMEFETGERYAGNLL